MMLIGSNQQLKEFKKYPSRQIQLFRISKSDLVIKPGVLVQELHLRLARTFQATSCLRNFNLDLLMKEMLRVLQNNYQHQLILRRRFDKVQQLVIHFFLRITLWTIFLQLAHQELLAHRPLIQLVKEDHIQPFNFVKHEV